MEILQAGLFYEFHRFRVVSRAGQPIQTRTNVEIAPQINREQALQQIRNGKDVYTPRRRDAEKLAISAYGQDPLYEPPHQATFFQHFHPGGEHPEFPEGQQGRPRAEAGPGHIFFGSRGENFVPRR
jgi:hypothetical protein